MQRSRLLACAALVAAFAASAAIVLNSQGARRYHLRFTSAGLLVKGGVVQIGGQKVGSVDSVTLTGAGEAEVDISLERAAPVLREGTTASLEEPSLSGAANRYLALNPGPNNAPALRSGATIASSRTTSVVELDELYDLFDPKTRQGLRNIIRGQRDTYTGRGADAARFYAALAPSLQTSDQLFRELRGDGTSLRRFVSASGRLARTLETSSDDLYGAVQESAQSTDAFARAAPELQQSLREFPSTLSEGRKSLAALRGAVDTLQPFLGRAAQAGQELPAFSTSLRRTLTGGAPALEQLARLLDDPKDRDLVALLQGLPSLSKAALPSLSHGETALRDGRPVIDQLRPYTPDLVSLWGNWATATSNYDANGHYARVAPAFGAFREAADGSGKTVLEPLAPSERTLAPQTGLLRRCPGSASQPAADGSAPVAKLTGQAPLQCDPSQVPAGP